VDARRLFEPLYGSIVLELDESLNLDELLKDVEYEFLGVTQEKTTIDFGNVGLDLVELCQKWQEPLEKVFPTATEPVSSTRQTV